MSNASGRGSPITVASSQPVAAAQQTELVDTLVLHNMVNDNKYVQSAGTGLSDVTPPGHVTKPAPGQRYFTNSVQNKNVKPKNIYQSGTGMSDVTPPGDVAVPVPMQVAPATTIA